MYTNLIKPRKAIVSTEWYKYAYAKLLWKKTTCELICEVGWQTVRLYDKSHII